jgi:hypothetical protein
MSDVIDKIDKTKFGEFKYYELNTLDNSRIRDFFYLII